MKHNLSVFFVWAICSSVGGGAFASPILFVDLEPSVAGIQDMLSLPVGASFTADVVIENVDDLQAFELDLDFGTNLSAIGVLGGDFLVAPVLNVESDVMPPDINFAETNLLGFGASGSGVLLSAKFEALSPGSSTLVLNDVLLSQPFGIPIPVAGTQDARVVVIPESRVPEPSTPLLLLLPLWVASRKRRG